MPRQRIRYVKSKDPLTQKEVSTPQSVEQLKSKDEDPPLTKDDVVVDKAIVEGNTLDQTTKKVLEVVSMGKAGQIPEKDVPTSEISAIPSIPDPQPSNVLAQTNTETTTALRKEGTFPLPKIEVAERDVVTVSLSNLEAKNISASLEASYSRFSAMTPLNAPETSPLQKFTYLASSQFFVPVIPPPPPIISITQRSIGSVFSKDINATDAANSNSQLISASYQFNRLCSGEWILEHKSPEGEHSFELKDNLNSRFFFGVIFKGVGPSSTLMFSAYEPYAFNLESYVRLIKECFGFVLTPVNQIRDITNESMTEMNMVLGVGSAPKFVDEECAFPPVACAYNTYLRTFLRARPMLVHYTTETRNQGRPIITTVATSTSSFPRMIQEMSVERLAQCKVGLDSWRIQMNNMATLGESLTLAIDIQTYDRAFVGINVHPAACEFHRVLMVSHELYFDQISHNLARSISQSEFISIISDWQSCLNITNKSVDLTTSSLISAWANVGIRDVEDHIVREILVEHYDPKVEYVSSEISLPGKSLIPLVNILMMFLFFPKLMAASADSVAQYLTQILTRGAFPYPPNIVTAPEAYRWLRNNSPIAAYLTNVNFCWIPVVPPAPPLDPKLNFHARANLQTHVPTNVRLVVEAALISMINYLTIVVQGFHPNDRKNITHLLVIFNNQIPDIAATFCDCYRLYYSIYASCPFLYTNFSLDPIHGPSRLGLFGNAIPQLAPSAITVQRVFQINLQIGGGFMVKFRKLTQNVAVGIPVFTNVVVNAFEDLYTMRNFILTFCSRVLFTIDVITSALYQPLINELRPDFGTVGGNGAVRALIHALSELFPPAGESDLYAFSSVVEWLSNVPSKIELYLFPQLCVAFDGHCLPGNRVFPAAAQWDLDLVIRPPSLFWRAAIERCDIYFRASVLQRYRCGGIIISKRSTDFVNPIWAPPPAFMWFNYSTSFGIELRDNVRLYRIGNQLLFSPDELTDRGIVIHLMMDVPIKEEHKELMCSLIDLKVLVICVISNVAFAYINPVSIIDVVEPTTASLLSLAENLLRRSGCCFPIDVVKYQTQLPDRQVEVVRIRKLWILHNVQDITIAGPLTAADPLTVYVGGYFATAPADVSTNIWNTILNGDDRLRSVAPTYHPDFFKDPISYTASINQANVVINV